MATDSGSERNFEMNPLFSRLQEAGGEDAIAVTGFVGPSGREGYVRLFLGLKNLSKSIEIAESDIIETVELPKSGLGAVAVFVRRDAALHHQLIEKAEDYEARRTRRGELRNVQRSGLRMRVRSEARDDCDVCTCVIFCDGTQCVPCTSQCLATQ